MKEGAFISPRTGDALSFIRGHFYFSIKVLQPPAGKKTNKLTESLLCGTSRGGTGMHFISVSVPPWSLSISVLRSALVYQHPALDMIPLWSFSHVFLPGCND